MTLALLSLLLPFVFTFTAFTFPFAFAFGFAAFGFAAFGFAAFGLGFASAFAFTCVSAFVAIHAKPVGTLASSAGKAFMHEYL